MSRRITTATDFQGTGNINKLAKNVYAKLQKQAVYREDLLSHFMSGKKTKQPSIDGLKFVIEVDGISGSSASIKVAKRSAGKIGTHAHYLAKPIKVFTYGQITETALRYNVSSEQTFLKQSLKMKMAKSMQEHRNKVEKILFSKSGEYGTVKAVRASTRTITVDDISTAQKLVVGEYVEIVSSANTAVSRGTFIVKSIGDLSTSNTVVLSKVTFNSATDAETVSTSTSVLSGVVATDVIWGSGDRVDYSGKFYGIYFWSPDSEERDDVVLNGTLDRATNPNNLAGLYHNVADASSPNAIYKGFNRIASKIQQFTVDVDKVVMNPRVYALIDEEQHGIDRQVTGSMLKVGERTAPSILVSGKKLEVLLSPLAHSEKIIFLKSKDTFELMCLGDFGKLDDRDGKTVQRGEQGDSDFSIEWRTLSMFNLCCKKPKSLAQLRLVGIQSAFDS